MVPRSTSAATAPEPRPIAQVEITIKMKQHDASGTATSAIIGAVMLGIALIFVWRSFYAMRIPKEI